MFYVQAILLGLLASVVFGPCLPRKILIALSTLWVVGVSAIYFRYGPIGQLGFYSNDQEIHEFMLGKLEWGGRPTSIQELIDRRYAYLGPAYLLTLGGIKPVLAMKFVAFVCFLLNATTVKNYFQSQGIRFRPVYVWLATGPVAFFFSLLALRETMMLASVTYVFVGKNPSMRLVGLAVITLLRPHMGVAILLGFIAVWLVKRISRDWYYLTLLLVLLGTIAAGAMVYSFALAAYHDTPFRFYGVFTKDQTFQVFANFTGLQFLNADLIAIERSLVDLWLPRIAFPETILVPVLFSIALFVPRKSIDTFKFTVLASIGFYLGITTTSDFNSFRQNLPFLSVMAIVVIQTMLDDRRKVSVADRDPQQLVTQTN
jgi:hypothetical protein